MTATIEFSVDGLVRDARRACLGLLAFVAICMVAHCGSGCLPAQAPNTVEQNYTADIIACAYFAGSPGPYDAHADWACRQSVDCKYGLGPCAPIEGGK